MAYCVECGKALSGGSPKFCGECGTPVTAPANSSAPTPAAPPPPQPGFYADPTQPGLLRWWTGTAWEYKSSDSPETRSRLFGDYTQRPTTPPVIINPSSRAPGYYACAADPARSRMWNGTEWTNETRPAASLPQVGTSGSKSVSGSRWVTALIVAATALILLTAVAGPLSRWFSDNPDWFANLSTGPTRSVTANVQCIDGLALVMNAQSLTFDASGSDAVRRQATEFARQESPNEAVNTAAKGVVDAVIAFADAADAASAQIASGSGLPGESMTIIGSLGPAWDAVDSASSRLTTACES